MKQVLYIPSLSAGGMSQHFLKNKEISPGLSSRFYSDEFPEIWRHKAFLLTAGHYYKKPNTRVDFGLEDSFVFGDSGGYQISTGAIPWSIDIRENIFKWLEHNSDVAANLDIPPAGKIYGGRYDEAFDISLDNFKYFERHQTGATDFLTVLQGPEMELYQRWFDAVKDFEFQGWAIGGTRKNIGNFMKALAVMLQGRAFEAPNFKWLHVLGASQPVDFIIMGIVQDNINKLYGAKCQVMSDSSTPGLTAVFGNYMWRPDYKTGNWVQCKLPKGDAATYSDEELVPHPHEDFPFDIHYSDVRSYKTHTIAQVTLANVLNYKRGVAEINRMVHLNRELFQSLSNRNIYMAIKCVDEMFAEPDRAKAIHKKYEKFLKKITLDTSNVVNQTSFNQFFAETE